MDLWKKSTELKALKGNISVHFSSSKISAVYGYLVKLTAYDQLLVNLDWAYFEKG